MRIRSRGDSEKADVLVKAVVYRRWLLDHVMSRKLHPPGRGRRRRRRRRHGMDPQLYRGDPSDVTVRMMVRDSRRRRRVVPHTPRGDDGRGGRPDRGRSRWDLSFWCS